MIDSFDLAKIHAKTEYQFRPPEGIVRHGDRSIMYFDSRVYEVTVRFTIKELTE